MDFRTRVKNAKLTAAEQLVAEFIIRNYQDVVFMTSTSLAKAAGTSQTSVIRLIKTLGYSGYDAFKKEAQNAARRSGETDTVSPVDRYRASVHAVEQRDIPIKTADHAIAAISEAASLNSEAAFSDSVAIIKQSRRVYICGFRSISFVAEFLAFGLRYARPDVFFCKDADARVFESFQDMTEEDCLILFVYPRYGMMNEQVKRIAEQAHAKLILITDKLSSYLAIHADAVLTCNPESDGFYNSIIPAAYLCEVLLNKYAEATDEVEKRYAYVDQFIDPLRFF